MNLVLDRTVVASPDLRTVSNFAVEAVKEARRRNITVFVVGDCDPVGLLRLTTKHNMDVTVPQVDGKAAQLQRCRSDGLAVYASGEEEDSDLANEAGAEFWGILGERGFSRKIPTAPNVYDLVERISEGASGSA